MGESLHCILLRNNRDTKAMILMLLLQSEIAMAVPMGKADPPSSDFGATRSGNLIEPQRRRGTEKTIGTTNGHESAFTSYGGTYL